MKLKNFYLLAVSIIAIGFYGCATVIPPAVDTFDASPYSVEVGKSAEISWSVRNSENAKISITDIGNNLPASGRATVKPMTNITYILKIEKEGTPLVERSLIITTFQPPPVFIATPPPPPAPVLKTVEDTFVSQGPDDGRFTIGAGSKRLMYGYPIPHSTSHFVVNVNGKLASNNPSFDKNTVQYISGKRQSKGEKGSPFTDIEYVFNGVKITQRLIPVDKDFKEVALNSFGRYYRIQYDVESQSTNTKDVAIMLLIDTMIDDNDACQMDADNTRVTREKTFPEGQIPSVVTVYRTPGNKKEMSGILVTDKGEAVKPQEMYIGRWPYFHTVTWKVKPEATTYFDSAILLRWANQTLNTGGKFTVATHYGLPFEGELRALNHTNLNSQSVSLTFAPGSAMPDAASLKRINELIKNKKVLGALVEAHADAVGSSDLNLRMTQRRANWLKNYLSSKGINKSSIIPKAYGETYADQSKPAQSKGRKEDRRGSVVIMTEADNI